MGLRTYTIIHLADEDRLLGVMSEHLPEVAINRETSSFIFRGVIYDVWDQVPSFGAVYDFDTGTRLLAILTALIGSEDNAVVLLEAVEPLVRQSEKPIVTRDADGKPTVVVPCADSIGYGICFMRASKSRSSLVGSQLTELAATLVAAKAPAATDPPAEAPADK